MSPTARRPDSSDPKIRSRMFLVLSALLLAVMLNCVALAADVGYLALVRRELQAAADEASLAALQDLSNVEAVRLVAEHCVTENHPHGLVTPSDVAMGNWNADSLTFVPGAEPVNAVEVTVRRSAFSNKLVTLFFAPVRGITQADVMASAIAVAPN